MYINMEKYKLKRKDQGYLYSSHYKGYTEVEGKKINKMMKAQGLTLEFDV
ncbi:hypothetical protein [Borrelia hermsii]|nr:hypothetical protein [Borrelia hermsii]UPA08441.1 hypothetical protein bhDAH_001148 [Borrelia hermsii DAH]